MFKGLTTPILIFLAALAATSVLFGGIEVEYGTTNFFQNRGIIFLICITLVPRLTLLFSSVAFGGILWWLGFFFMPRLLVAVLATVAYLKTNPFLVGVAWFVALTGEILEKKKLSTRPRFVFRTFRGAESPRERSTGPVIDDNGVIEAEFTKKD